MLISHRRQGGRRASCGRAGLGWQAALHGLGHLSFAAHFMDEIILAWCLGDSESFPKQWLLLLFYCNHI